MKPKIKELKSWNFIWSIVIKHKILIVDMEKWKAVVCLFRGAYKENNLFSLKKKWLKIYFVIEVSFYSDISIFVIETVQQYLTSIILISNYSNLLQKLTWCTYT